jgi:NADH-quinone oxidoreductase subunit E
MQTETETETSSYLDWARAMRARVRDIAAEWEDVEGNLIMILHAIQKEFGYISRGAALELAETTGIPVARIYEVITFYHYFRLTPPGRHRIQVCMGTACYLKGAQKLHSELENQLRAAGGGRAGVQVETVRCIGCCGMAPAVVVDDETVGRLCPGDMREMLNRTLKE